VSLLTLKRLRQHRLDKHTHHPPFGNSDGCCSDNEGNAGLSFPKHDEEFVLPYFKKIIGSMQGRWAYLVHLKLLQLKSPNRILLIVCGMMKGVTNEDIDVGYFFHATKSIIIMTIRKWQRKELKNNFLFL
jgi:hypothetical protein